MNHPMQSPNPSSAPILKRNLTLRPARLARFSLLEKYPLESELKAFLPASGLPHALDITLV